MNKAVFLDRDGILNAMVYRADTGKWDSPFCLDEFQLLPGVAQAVNQIRHLGYKAIVVSNQPGVARGKCGPEFLDLLDQRLRDDLAREDAFIDAIYYCFHSTSGTVEHYTRVCDCRKPKPGLLLKAASEHHIDLTCSYMIGDRMVDAEAGLAAGCQSILVSDSPVSPGNGSNGRSNVWQAGNLLEAIALIREQQHERSGILGIR